MKLLPDIKRWVERESGEVNYYITQLLSGHGYFRKFLFRIGKTNEPSCIYGDADIDDAEHTFFYCEKWFRQRTAAEMITGRLSAENIVSKMLENEESWNAVARFTESILKAKKRDLDRQASLAATTESSEQRRGLDGG